MTENRLCHYALILTVGTLLFLPNLGAFALWEEDEAHNAQCAQEMADADTWVVPTFNFKLRPDKPILQYWAIRFSYLLFGANEWSARLPSALVSLISLLLCYELGRSLFDPLTGLVSALLLASSIMFNVAAHAVTPDAFLVATVLAGLTAFAIGYRRGSSTWLVTSSVASALAMLAKGPVGVILPLGIVGCFLLWQRQLRLLFTPRLFLGAALFVLVAVPWYVRVGIETRFEFIRGFFFKHNLERFQSGMEGHGAGWWFHPLVLFVTFAPGSIFLLLAIWSAWGGESSVPVHTAGNWRRRLRAMIVPVQREDWAYRLLACWIAVWMTFFSIAATKLPNYLLPMFPALAVLVARFLVRWMRGEVRLPIWVTNTLFACFAVMGIVIGVGLLVGAGALPGIGTRAIPALLPCAVIGLVPVAFGWLAFRWERKGRRTRVLAGILGASCLTIAVLAGAIPGELESGRAIKALAQRLAAEPIEGDRLIGCHRAYHPSLVYYTNRLVWRSLSDDRAVDLLNSPWPAFLIVSEKNWPRLSTRVRSECSILARAPEFKAGDHLLLVYNHGQCSIDELRPAWVSSRLGSSPHPSVMNVQPSPTADSR